MSSLNPSFWVQHLMLRRGVDAPTLRHIRNTPIHSLSMPSQPESKDRNGDDEGCVKQTVDFGVESGRT